MPIPQFLKSNLLVYHLQPSVHKQNFTVCDLLGSATDGLTLYDLEEIAEQVYSFSSINPTSMEVTFYATQPDAQNQINGLESPFANTVANQVIYARCPASPSISKHYASASFKLVPPITPTKKNQVQFFNQTLIPALRSRNKS